jgi:hypothetical protein
VRGFNEVIRACHVRRVLASRALALALLAGVNTAQAAPVSCPPPAGASLRLGSTDAQARLEWIDARLTETASDSRTWAWLWGGGIAVSGLVSLSVTPFIRPQDRIDWYTGAVSAAIGVFPFILKPPRVIRDSGELREQLRKAPPAANPAALCPVLADAEARLERDAKDQRQQQAWWLHAGNVGFNVGIALFLGLGYGHWTAGIINGAAGVVVGEAILLTQPTSSIDDLHTYRAGNIGPLMPKGTALFRYSTSF